MTVRLRAHHLLCMLTYVGRGYSPAFTANLDEIVSRLNAGEDLLLIEGPDDICRPLLDGSPHAHCLNARVNQRDTRAAHALSHWLGQAIDPGRAIKPDKKLIERMRSAFALGKTRQACLGCEWIDLCSTVARQDFEGALLAPDMHG
ncbi:DUF1284 domain-containing protein [Nitratireductor kimnyeongensis]|uniref:DUF1284 domain-containing protein n=1 Tax=Nitratireductor kimnyeongensis TaxID=430679 RepID=A0ABW0T9Q6_9HYPH|nr:DUF1284 domain-containing protein [Nitratireductor kimnyeongensis]QZZ36067.1 DUF1284 domain-containing protein [Nitratireductor kimnyeongensis]